MATGTYRTTLATRGLQPFLWTQFLGAFNDNLYKIVVSFYAIRALGPVDGMSVTAAVFVAPFLLFSGYAGHLADVRSKRSVLVWTKVLEIAAMLLALPALVTGRLDLQLAVLFLMATQATFFSPAKYGIVPEIAADSDISRVNGLLEMSTFAAIVLGTAAGGSMFQAWHDQSVVVAGVLIAIAIAGTLTSLWIPTVPPSRPTQRFNANPFGEIGAGLARLLPDRTLWMTVVGLSYFWFLGALLQQALMPWGQGAFGIGEAAATRLYTFLAIGIGLGSLLAGRLSGDKVELGLVPIGGFGLGVFGLLLVWSTSSYWLAAAVLLMLGASGGFFAVPLNALLQHRPDDDEKGRVLGTNNLINTIGILLAAAAFWFTGTYLAWPLERVLIAAGILTLIASVYALATLPDFFMRFVLWSLTHTIYRITIVGQPNIPRRGAALLVVNHVSVIDGALVGASLQRFVRFLVYGPYFRLPVIHWLMRQMRAIPITAGNKREVVEAVERARAELQAGHVVCIFAEGAISRTGNLLPFKRGFERIVAGLDVPIVPVYLDRVWGSVFSFKRERFFWKMPEQVPYPVTVAFGDPMPSTSTAGEVRQAIMELGTDAMRHRRPATDLLHVEFIRKARRKWTSRAMADTTGQDLTYGRALMGGLAFSRVIARRTPGEENVATLLPASVGGALANIAILCAGKTVVNLNFTIGQEALDAAIAQAGIKTILTSKKFIEKLELPVMPQMVFLEDLRKEITKGDKIVALLHARLAPISWLRRRYGGGKTSESLATIIFSSGSTGVPKGVMITHHNVLANVDSLAQIFPMDERDCFIGVLPLFHSFGFTGTFWFPLLQGASVVYHPNPMDAKTVGEIAEKYKATMLISTPTFCNAYLRRVSKEQFATLKYAIVGAEKLREPLATEFREKYGISLLEGYGSTEMAPVVAVNRPNVGGASGGQIGTKAGSVGHPIPGVAAMIVDRDTGTGPLVGQEGLLLVKGPNMMKGYLDAPEKTAEVIRDGWYVTGDIARIDEDGFIFITDRLSRFSKIGGEMVPHVRIEEAINAVIGDACSVVTAVPDPARGERLIAFYTRGDVPPEIVWEKLSATDLPKLWIPRRDNLLPIEAIPTLGTGKVDLRRVKDMAIALTPTPPQTTPSSAR